MKKVISFSLWGKNSTYTQGAIINANLAQHFYPEFECWIYVHKDTVPTEIITELSKIPNVKIIYKSGDLTNLTIKPLMWRFEAIDDPAVELMLSRDTDTRITTREKLAVDEWIKSGAIFHIMRDHPHHDFKILGGMFGTRKLPQMNWGDLIHAYPRIGDRDYDQKFLEEKIYPLIKNDAIIHTAFHSYEGEKYSAFPTPYTDKHEFVGEYIFHDGSRSIPHVINLLQESNIEPLPSSFTPSFPNQPLISIVIGTYQRIKFLPLTISSIREELKNIPHEIIVVDGGSNDGTIDWLTQQKDIITIVQHNRGLWHEKPIIRRSWGYFMNLGFKSAQGKYVCMLSDDCIATPGSIANGLNLFERSLKADFNIGGVAFYWRNWPAQSEYVVGQTWGDKIFINHGIYLNDALKSVGYVDENNYSFYHADGDLCLKMWEKGYELIDCPYSYIEHYVDPQEEVRTSNLTTQPTDWATYTNKWKPLFGEPTKDWIIRHYSDSSNSVKKFEDALEITITKPKNLSYRIRKFLFG